MKPSIFTQAEVRSALERSAEWIRSRVASEHDQCDHIPVIHQALEAFVEILMYELRLNLPSGGENETAPTNGTVSGEDDGEETS